ncbi:MAG: putative CtpA-like serine protease [Legionellaceae bacterium]
MKIKYSNLGNMLIIILSFLFMSSAKAETIPVPVKDIQRFTAAISQIKNYYVETINDEKLFDEAIRGMLAGLDPHSSYLDEEDLKELQNVTKGEFSGLGLEVIPDNGALKVISPIDDTPAQRAGIQPGDLIIRINKEAINKMTLREAIVKMRGKPRTLVTLTILRKGETKPFKIKLIRELIAVKSVKKQILSKNYGYIRISSFQNNTESELIKAIKSLVYQSGDDLKGLILDLRNNPGGLLDSAIDVTNLFLDSPKLKFNKLIVYTKGRYPSSQYQAKATGEDILKEAPLVVLINEGSASGSEIVAGALQDHKRAIVMGMNSFGKGSVQTILPLDTKTALKLTTALYYTPAGRSIQARGIHPDIEVEELVVHSHNQQKHSPFTLKEADLKGHLNNHTKEIITKIVPEIKNEENNEVMPVASLPSLKTDFQLREAFNLLRAMAITQHH